MIISLARGLLRASCSIPGAFYGVGRSNAPVRLAPGEVCLAARIAARAGGLLHRRFTLAERLRARQYTSLWHSAVGLPRLAVSQHRGPVESGLSSARTCRAAIIRPA